MDNRSELIEILKSKSIDELDKKSLKVFINNCDNEQYKNIAKNVLEHLKTKKNLEKQIKESQKKLSSLYVSNGLVREKLGSILNNNGFIPNLEVCYRVNCLSKRMEEWVVGEYETNENFRYFKTESEAKEYIDFLDKIKVGVRFKIKDKRKWNNGWFNDDAKKFYEISERETVYNFDDDKIWTIVKTGYFEDGSPMPLTECKCKDDEGRDIIDWEIPRYMFRNVIFIEESN
jgi:hypothetical protein